MEIFREKSEVLLADRRCKRRFILDVWQVPKYTS